MKNQTRPDPLERILKFAGRREPVDRQRTARVQDNVHARWLAMLGRRRASRRRRWLAWAGTGMAATAMALALILWLPRPG
ncbi:MAG: hypothetical protein WB812_11810, partial [Woeseiaceae bacterium]